MNALSPTVPTFFRSFMFAMPRVIVRKMIGPITILTSEMNVSPSGRIARAVSGETMPRITPIAIATSTRKVRFLRRRRGGIWGEGGGGRVRPYHSPATTYHLQPTQPLHDRWRDVRQDRVTTT